MLLRRQERRKQRVTWRKWRKESRTRDKDDLFAFMDERMLWVGHSHPIVEHSVRIRIDVAIYSSLFPTPPESIVSRMPNHSRSFVCLRSCDQDVRRLRHCLNFRLGLLQLSISQQPRATLSALGIVPFWRHWCSPNFHKNSSQNKQKVRRKIFKILLQVAKRKEPHKSQGVSGRISYCTSYRNILFVWWDTRRVLSAYTKLKDYEEEKEMRSKNLFASPLFSAVGKPGSGCNKQQQHLLPQFTNKRMIYTS